MAVYEEQIVFKCDSCGELIMGTPDVVETCSCFNSTAGEIDERDIEEYMSFNDVNTFYVPIIVTETKPTEDRYYPMAYYRYYSFEPRHVCGNCAINESVGERYRQLMREWEEWAIDAKLLD